MDTRLRVVVALLFAACGLVASACAPSAEIVWLGEGEGGATLTGCPIDDCGPLLGLAEQGLTRERPRHAAIVQERLGRPACGPTPQTLCTYGGPLGIASRWAVVFDLADGSTSIVSVLCFDVANANGATVEWNGQHCLSS